MKKTLKTAADNAPERGNSLKIEESDGGKAENVGREVDLAPGGCPPSAPPAGMGPCITDAWLDSGPIVVRCGLSGVRSEGEAPLTL